MANISRQRINQRVKKGSLPAVKFRGGTYIDVNDALEFIQARNPEVTLPDLEKFGKQLSV